MADSSTKDSAPAQTSGQAQDVDISNAAEQSTSVPSASFTQGQTADDQTAATVEEQSADKRDKEPPDTIKKPERKMSRTSDKSTGSQVGGLSQQGTTASAFSYDGFGGYHPVMGARRGFSQ